MPELRQQFSFCCTDQASCQSSGWSKQSYTSGSRHGVDVHTLTKSKSHEEPHCALLASSSALHTRSPWPWQSFCASEKVFSVKHSRITAAASGSSPQQRTAILCETWTQASCMWFLFFRGQPTMDFILLVSGARRPRGPRPCAVVAAPAAAAVWPVVAGAAASSVGAGPPSLSSAVVVVSVVVGLTGVAVVGLTAVVVERVVELLEVVCVALLVLVAGGVVLVLLVAGVVLVLVLGAVLLLLLLAGVVLLLVAICVALVLAAASELLGAVLVAAGAFSALSALELARPSPPTHCMHCWLTALDPENRKL